MPQVGSAEEGPGDRDGFAAPDVCGAALVDEHRDQVVGLLDEVRLRCGGVDLPVADHLADYPAVHSALAESWDVVLSALNEALRDGPPVTAAPTDLSVYVALLDEIRRTDHNLMLARLRHQDASLGRVREALAMLREAQSTDELIELATEAIGLLGFDRSILSRIEESAWIPENVWVGRDRQWAREILEAGCRDHRLLDRTLVETEMVQRKVPILVHDVQARPAVHRPIAEASLSRSYAAAPLMAGNDVVGFLHADCYYQGRELDGFDRRLLATFAEGVGHALARTATMDRLAAIRAGFDQLSGTLGSAVGERLRHCGPLPRPRAAVSSGGATQRHAGYRPTGGDGERLTRRELEVLALMASGDTNGRIGRRLVISEGTVKTHVKHILRKLGAANRAEAVSRWLGMEYERGGRGAAPGLRRFL